MQIDKEEKSEKDTASKDGKVEKQEAKPAGKDAAGKEKGGKESKDKGIQLMLQLLPFVIGLYKMKV